MNRTMTISGPRIGRKSWLKFIPYILVLPAVIILAVFYIYPIFYNLFLSFHSWNMRGDMKFVGLKNYIELFQNADFRQSIWNTVIYMLMNVSLTVILAIALAMF